jgi:hypothetical protein
MIENAPTGSTAVFNLHNGSVFRLLTLMTHYRQPQNFSKARMAEAERVLKRWVVKCIPNDNPPPLDVLEALCDDLNTPKAIAAMHVYRREDGRKLFAAMRFLGFFEGYGTTPHEWKTIPADHIGGMSPGPDVAAHGRSA